MKEASRKLQQMTFEGSDSATSSPASEAGPTRSNSQGGRKKERSGPDHVRVSRFRALDSEKAMPTNDTCGPLFISSSPSAVLQQCLESKLRARMDVNGSPEYVLTWKELDMPSGVPICQLRASTRRTSDSDSGGWPTAQAHDGKGKPGAGCVSGGGATVGSEYHGWPSPRVGGNGRTGTKYKGRIEDAAALA